MSVRRKEQEAEAEAEAAKLTVKVRSPELGLPDEEIARIEALEASKKAASDAASARLKATDYEVGGPVPEPYLGAGVYADAAFREREKLGARIRRHLHHQPADKDAELLGE